MINNHFHIKHRPQAIKESCFLLSRVDIRLALKNQNGIFVNVLVPELVLLLSFLGEREVQINFYFS